MLSVRVIMPIRHDWTQQLCWSKWGTGYLMHIFLLKNAQVHSHVACATSFPLMEIASHSSEAVDCVTPTTNGIGFAYPPWNHVCGSYDVMRIYVIAICTALYRQWISSFWLIDAIWQHKFGSINCQSFNRVGWRGLCTSIMNFLVIYMGHFECSRFNSE